MAGRQAMSILDRPATLVPTRNLAEGVAAAFAFQPTLSAQENTRAMTSALGDVRTGLVTEAIRAATVDGRAIRPGDVLGLVDDRIDVVGSDRIDVGVKLLQILAANRAEIVTLYVGEGVDLTEADKFRVRVIAEFGPKQVEVVQGGQSHYPYILACE